MYTCRRECIKGREKSEREKERYLRVCVCKRLSVRKRERDVREEEKERQGDKGSQKHQITMTNQGLK